MTEQQSTTPTPKRLCRNLSKKMIAGVAAGIADYLSVDPGIIRLLFVVMGLFGGSGIPLYIILWIILPSDDSEKSTDTRETVEKNVAEMKQKAQSVTQSLTGSVVKTGSSQSWFGVLVVIVGSVFLLNNYGVIPALDFERLWPIVLILFGVYVISRNDR